MYANILKIIFLYLYYIKNHNDYLKNIQLIPRRNLKLENIMGKLNEKSIMSVRFLIIHIFNNLDGFNNNKIQKY